MVEDGSESTDRMANDEEEEEEEDEAEVDQAFFRGVDVSQRNIPKGLKFLFHVFFIALFSWL